MAAGSLKYLSQDEATKIDEELFNDYQFSVDQLMELAGLSVATAVAKSFPLSSFPVSPDVEVLVVVGPGNNGGDGLVCARHLKLFGYAPVVVYPRQTDKDVYKRLVHQCKSMDIPFLETVPDKDTAKDSYQLIIDALFGFSFKPPVGPELQPALNLMMHASIPICSIDVPSGWHVEDGNDEGIKPACLVSLTAPKRCAQKFKGKFHWLGGRFVPKYLEKKFALNLPLYPDTDCIVRLS